MKNYLFRNLSEIVTEEYEIFSNLSLRLRIGAVSALILFYFSLVILTHLMIYPHLLESRKATTILLIIYAFVAVIAILTILPILFPSLKNKSSLAMLLLIALNSFPFVLLILLVPKLRKYKTAIISTVVFVSIVVVGVVLIYEGTSQNLLSEQPDAASVVLWLTGLLSIFVGMFMYGYVTERTSIEKTKIETEVNIAREIQSQLVPVVDESNQRYQLFGRTLPAHQIGGDFFDIIWRSEDKLLLVIGDVSGHNIAAGLLMAITKGSLRTAIQHDSSLSQIVESINHTVWENSDKRMFVSFKCLEIDFHSEMIKIVNAGHLPVLHYKNTEQKILEINQAGLALGITDNVSYQSQSLTYQKGDYFILLTDGVIEAMSPKSEQFGFDRTREILNSASLGEGPKMTYNHLMQELVDFTGSDSLSDDLTYLAVRLA